jgi:hypothetical protein
MCDDYEIREMQEREAMWRADDRDEVVAELERLASVDEDEAATLAPLRSMANRVSRCEASAAAYRHAARIVQERL